MDNWKTFIFFIPQVLYVKLLEITDSRYASNWVFGLLPCTESACTLRFNFSLVRVILSLSTVLSLTASINVKQLLAHLLVSHCSFELCCVCRCSQILCQPVGHAQPEKLPPFLHVCGLDISVLWQHRPWWKNKWWRIAFCFIHFHNIHLN